MWKQWWHFYVTVAALLTLMILLVRSETVTNAARSLAEWLFVMMQS